MINALITIPSGSTILLHVCAHNPTGVDPTQSQWKKIAKALKAKKHVPFFDCAYQGLASGDLDKDAWPIRHFVDLDMDAILIAQSFAKNFGLYGERAGALHIVARTRDGAARVQGQLHKLQRVIISTPPAYGARLISLILQNSSLYEQWLEDVRTMHARMTNMPQSIATPSAAERYARQLGLCHQSKRNVLLHRIQRIPSGDIEKKVPCIHDHRRACQHCWLKRKECGVCCECVQGGTGSLLPCAALKTALQMQTFEVLRRL